MSLPGALRGCLAALLAGSTPLPAQPAPGKGDLLMLEQWRSHPRSPAAYVADQFGRGRRWVLVGEYHRIRHDAQLLLDLVPLLHRETAVRALALELVTVEGTEAANRLVTADTFDRDAALALYRRMNPELNAAEYFEVLEAVWRSNQALGPLRGLMRLVGLRPEIDWEAFHFGTPVQQARERARLEAYDATMAETLERQLLARGEPALVFTGVAHATAKFTEFWAGTDRPLPRMGNLVYREPYRRFIWCVALHAPMWDADSRREVYPFGGRLDRLMAAYQQDIGFDMAGTVFAGLRERGASPRSMLRLAFGEAYDGYILRKTPILEYLGATCLQDWIRTEADRRWLSRHLPSAEAGAELSRLTLAEAQAQACAPGDAGEGFRRRFAGLGKP